MFSNQCLRWIFQQEEEDDDVNKPYDVFISYSHHDEDYVNEVNNRYLPVILTFLNDWISLHWVTYFGQCFSSFFLPFFAKMHLNYFASDGHCCKFYLSFQ